MKTIGPAAHGSEHDQLENDKFPYKLDHRLSNRLSGIDSLIDGNRQYPKSKEKHSHFECFVIF